MFKKLVLGTLAAGTAGTLLLGGSAGSYVQTGLHSIRDEVKAAIPVDVELARCKRMIAAITPEISDNLKRIAREEVEVERLAEDVDTKQQNLETAKSHLLRLKSDLASGSATYSYAGRQYTADQVRADLAGRFEAYKTQAANVEQLQRLLDARRQKLDVARGSLDKMLASKHQMQLQIESLEARLMMIEVSESAAQLNLSDSQLAQTRKLIDEIDTQLEVAERLTAVDAEPLAAIPLDTPEATDVLEQIDSYFSGGEITAAAVAVEDDA